LRFDPLEPFLAATFFAALAVFLGDLRAGLAAVFFFDDEPLPLEKIVSQLSEYCFVAPMRTTLISQSCSRIEKKLTTDCTVGHE
jgi:hypothetical protein